MRFVRKYIKIISLVVIVIFIVFLVVLKIYLNNNANREREREQIVEDEVILKEELEEVETVSNVSVDIKGAVAYPGVYEIEDDKKVIDVVTKAGGLTEDADTSMINLAKKVSNEMVIIIYTKEEVEKYSKEEEIVKVIDKECVCPKITNDACINSANNDSNDSKKEDTTDKGNAVTNAKINLNSASLEELQTLTGIGESKAKAIIDYRNEHGKFSNIEEIKEVSGIGESLYEKIKEDITV